MKVNWSALLDRTALVLFPAVVVLLVWKLGFYLSTTPVTGWDTVGHLHLARQYRSMLPEFSSMGYDPAWFQGFPVFYFYPPFFYFATAHLDLLLGGVAGLPFAAAFNVGLLLTLLFFCLAYVRLAALLLEDVEPVRRLLLVSFGLLVYLSFPGRGLQGTGLVGFLNGTVAATLAHGLALSAFFFLERFRRGIRTGNAPVANFVLFLATGALVFYTHYLTAVFFLLLLSLYALLFRREFDGRVLAGFILGPVALAWVPALTYFSFRDFFSGTASLPDYPALISLIGVDFLDRMLAEPGFVLPLLRELLVEFKWINLLLAVVFARYIARTLRRGLPGVLPRFILLATLALLWISQDESLAFLLYPFGIHWYRVFDLFFSFFTLTLLFAFSDELSARRDRFRANLALGALTLLLLARFFLWDPTAHERYASMDLEGYGSDTTGLEGFLAALPPGSLILPEKLRNRDFQGSPHALDYYIEKHGHRNALGLTVESSLTAMLEYAYLSRGMSHIFAWGVDLNWRDQLFQNAPPSEFLPAYLRRSGVQYVLGRTRRLRTYLDERPEFFQPVYRDRVVQAYRVLNPRPALAYHDASPLGFLSYQRVRGEPLPGRPYRRFLLEANRVRLRLGAGTPVVNLDPVYDPARHETFQNDLSGLVLFNHGPGLAPSHEASRFARPDRVLILVNFEKTEPDPVPTRYLYTLLNVPGGGGESAGRTLRWQALNDLDPHPERIAVAASQIETAANASCVPLEIKLSYFPHWRAAGDLPVYQTEDNHMLVCTDGAGARLSFESPLSEALTAMMYALVLSGLGAGTWSTWRRFRFHK